MEKFDYECDVVVVGGGAGGMTAAVVGSVLKGDVLLVEKTSQVGGTSALSGGAIWVPNNPYMAQVGQSDSPEEARAYMKTCIGNAGSEERIDSYVHHAPQMVRFMKRHSRVRFGPVPYPDYYPEREGGKSTGRTLQPVPFSLAKLGRHRDRLRPPGRQTLALGRFAFAMHEARHMMLRSRGWQLTFARNLLAYWLDLPMRLRTKRARRQTMGGALTTRLLVSMRDRKIPIWFDSALEDILYTKERVVGLVVRRGNRKMLVKARHGVILASGGFDHNQEMRERHLPTPTKEQWSAGHVGNTGDAQRLGQNLGAAMELMDGAWWAPAIALPWEDRSRPLFAERAFPGCIIVNSRGKRFVNESAPYLDVGAAMYQAHSKAKPAVPAYMIFDATYRRKYPCGPLLPSSPTMDERVAKRLVGPVFKKAQTLEALAKTLGIDARGLVSTVQKMETYAHMGKDPEFQRGDSLYDRFYADPKVGPNPSLAPLDTPPFYGVALYPGDIGTKGGFKTNGYGQVLKVNGMPIEGLYATGNCSSSVMGYTYPGAGSTIGPAMTFAYTAVHHALGRDLQ